MPPPSMANKGKRHHTVVSALLFGGCLVVAIPCGRPIGSALAARMRRRTRFPRLSPAGRP